MKLSNIVTVGLVISGIGLLPGIVRALDANQEILISQFNVNVNLDIPIKKEKEEETSTEQEFLGFSGKYAEYADTFNGFKFEVPVEFTRKDKGQVSTWLGPQINNSGTVIAVNAVPLSGVSSEQLLETYKLQYEKDAFYTDVTPLEVKFDNKKVPALRLREINKQQGSRSEKNPDDAHRWHLYVFGNERIYNITMSASFETFQDNKVQAVYENIIDSVELVAIEE